VGRSPLVGQQDAAGVELNGVVGHVRVRDREEVDAVATGVLEPGRCFALCIAAGSGPGVVALDDVVLDSDLRRNEGVDALAEAPVIVNPFSSADVAS